MDSAGDEPAHAATVGGLMRPHGLVLRQAAITRRQQGRAATEIAIELGCSARSVNRWWQRWQAEGTVQPRPIPGRAPVITGSMADALSRYVATHPSVTLANLCTWLRITQHCSVSLATMWRTLQRLGWRHQR